MQITEIYGTVKNYEWGGKDFIPSVFGNYDGRPQAEYWIDRTPDGRLFRFLFKVLSIAAPLSLQCHPSKEQAVEGFARDRVNYVDNNGKPEIFCALTPAELLCGVRQGVSKAEVLELLQNHQAELPQLLPEVMNAMVLAPGEAVYIKPGTLHQYRSGNGVELMAHSDNVIRGGMTSKRIDLKELERIGDFSAGPTKTVSVKTDSSGRTEYVTPCPDFCLKYAATGSYRVQEQMESAALVIEGSAALNGRRYGRGTCLYIPRDAEYTLEVEGGVYFAS